jgi:hypothetical protein
VDVRVPAGVDQSVFVPAHGDEPAAGFKQPARSQAGLTEQRHAVLFAQAARLTLDVESVAQRARSQYRESDRTMPIERLVSRTVIEGTARGLELLHKRNTRVQPIERQPLGGGQ